MMKNHVTATIMIHSIGKCQCLESHMMLRHSVLLLAVFYFIMKGRMKTLSCTNILTILSIVIVSLICFHLSN